MKIKVLVLVCVLYTLGIITYRVFHEKEGFVYHPASGSLYRVVLTHELDTRHRLSYLNPFKRYTYLRISSILREGNLGRLLEWNRYYAILQSNDPNDIDSALSRYIYWFEEHRRIREQEWLPFYGSYLPRLDLDVKTLLPPVWQSLAEPYAKLGQRFAPSGGVLPIDMVLLQPDRQGMGVTVLRDSVLIYGDPAIELTETYLLLDQFAALAGTAVPSASPPWQDNATVVGNATSPSLGHGDNGGNETETRTGVSVPAQ